MRLNPIIFGTSCLGNLYREIPMETKVAVAAEWFKAYIYTYVPALATITNKNVFLLGSADILFTLYYTRLEEELINTLQSLAAQ